MASWESNSDITRDMDYLSGIKHSSRECKPYTAWGRGRIINQEIINPEEFDNSIKSSGSVSKEDFTWFPEKPSLEKLPDSIGRGKKLEILKKSYVLQGKDLEVHQQVRAVMGPGHSNAFIEASYRQRVNGSNVDNDCGNLPFKQIEDSDEKEKHPCISTASSPVGNNEGAVLDTSKTSCDSKSAVKTSKEMKSSQRKKPRQYRNAVLESLVKLGGAGNVAAVQTSTDHLPISKEILHSPVKRNTNIPPAGYSSKQYYNSSSSTPNVQPSLFVLNESEFPKL